MKFFLDNCLSPRLGRALRILAELQEYEIVHLSEKFDRRNIPDQEWIGQLGREGAWVIISGDVRISKGKAERRAWHESKLTAFFFGGKWANQRYWKQAEDLIRWWPRITLEARNTTQGTGYLIPLKGKNFKVIYTPED